MTDYSISAVLKMSELKTYFGGGLIFRHIDDNNFATLRFSGTSESNTNVELIKFENGVSTKLSVIPYIFNTSDYYTFDVQINGDNVTAYINNVPVIENVSIGDSLSHGNVGLRTYAGTVFLDNITVSEISDTVYIAGGEIEGSTVKLSVTNNSHETECVVAAAVYNKDDILETLKLTPIILNENSSNAVRADIDTGVSMENKTAKIMLLDKNNTLTPICKAAYYGYEQEQPETSAPVCTPASKPTAVPTSSPTLKPTAAPTSPPSYSDGVEVVSGNKVSDMLYCAFSSEEYTHDLKYRLYVPSDYDYTQKYPLLVYLNGAGTRGNDNTKQLSNLAPLLNPIISSDSDNRCIVAVPQCPSNEQWVDTPWANGSYSIDNISISDELSMVNGMIDELCAKYHIDTDRLYISGQSMGGYGAWDMIMRYPDKFAAAVINCGAADPSKAELIKDMPIMVLHGSADPTVPVSGSRDMVNALKSLGSDVMYYEYENNDHYIQRRMFENPSMWLDFLMNQSKGAPEQAGPPYSEYELVSVNQFNKEIPSTYLSNQSDVWKISSTGDGMLSATTSSNSSAAIYDSSTLDMTDYTASAYLKFSPGTDGGAGIVVRYINDSTLLTVRFVKGTSSRLQVVELQSGANNIMKDYPFEWDYDTLYNMKVAAQSFHGHLLTKTG